ncbi:T9SS type A sorting domain-containing protein [Nibribacter ruber]|uniref:T9SS type A sorting domain-containing protein n=1 Tax=Nibribacter ruber TaxID=2698458 RepID=A0A6P1NVQ7_9BACT|nr:T9SS type A sorting domain-containing protein [Nibribacter ruber]QHL87926.1 T9SS type A sorting domain-containing protein [Nibribacter ruber]
MKHALLAIFGLFLSLLIFNNEAQAFTKGFRADTDSLQTLPITGSPFCVGSSVTVPYYTNVTFPVGNTFTVQLSGTTGSFSAPRILGSAQGRTSGQIQVTLPTNLTAGTAYRIRVVASNPTTGMKVLDNGTNLTIGTPPATPAITSNSGVCAGGTLTLSSSKVTGATYSWSGPNGFQATGSVISIPNAEVAASGVYTLTITVNGCSTSNSATVEVKPASANAGPDKVICPGQGVQLTASGGVSYSWTPVTTLDNSTSATPIASPTVTTTYTVQVTNANGCVRSDQVVVTVNPLPTLVIAPAAPSICAGTSVQLQATGAASYSWSPATGLDDPTSATPIASPAQTTTYTVTGTSAAGCVNTKTVTVTVKALPIANAGFDRSLCSGQALALGTSATSSGTYLWEPATDLSSATVKNPVFALVNTTNAPITRTYKLTVTTNGCTSTDEVTLTVNPAVPASAGPDVAICAGNSTQLNASGGSTYRWNPTTNLSDPNIANPVAFPTATTRYIVTVTNAEGCSRNDTVFVNVAPNPVLTVLPAAPSVCVGSSVQLQASGATSYAWSPATGLDDPTSASPIANPTVTTTYTVTGTSAAGCSISKTVTVKVNPIPVANAGVDKVVCSRQAIVLGTAATTGYTYSWSPAIGLSSTKVANPTLTYISESNEPIVVDYTVTVTANGCTSTDVVRVTVNPAAYAGPDIAVCAGGSAQLQAFGGLTYSWSPTTGLSDPTIANPVVTPTATTTYTVTVTGPNAICLKTDQIKVTVNPLPVISANATLGTICQGASTTLSATGGVRYEWAPATGLSDATSANSVATPTETTTYTVTGTDAKGCTNTARVTITVLPKPVVTIQPSGTTTLCQGNNVTLTASQGTSYVWSNGATTSSITVSEAGSYSVTVTNAQGCSNTSEAVQVTVNPLPVVMLDAFATICQDKSPFTLTGGSPAGGTYSGPGVSNNQFSARTVGAGTYTIMYAYTDANGCTNAASQSITVSTCLGLEEEVIQATFKAAPNPAKDVLSLETSIITKTDVQLQLISLSGKVVKEEQVKSFKGTLKRQWLVQHLSKGVYILRLTTANASLQKKIVIQ